MSALREQDFLIRTPTLVCQGTIRKEDGKWIVDKIDRRMHSLLGITAQELVDKCEGWNWKVERYKR